MRRSEQEALCKTEGEPKETQLKADISKPKWLRDRKEVANSSDAKSKINGFDSTLEAAQGVKVASKRQSFRSNEAESICAASETKGLGSKRAGDRANNEDPGQVLSTTGRE